MKFSCEKSLLSEAVSAVVRAVPQKSAIQVLEGILLSCDQNSLKLTGYDLDMGIESEIEASVQEKGKTVLNARMLGDIVRKLPGGTVSFFCDDKNAVTIKSKSAEFSLLAMPAEEYPEIPEFTAEKMLEMDEASLKAAVNQTIYAVSDSDSRPILKGVLFNINGQELTMVSVDGFRLAMKKQKISNPSDEDFSFVVPGKALSEISRLVGEKDRPVSISLAKKNILFKYENVTMVSRLLEGEFIDYKNVIPKDEKVTAEVDTGMLLEAVERAALIVSEKIKNPIVFNFDFDSIKLTAKSSLGSAYDELAAQLTGDPLEIGLNSGFLLDALRACDRETVKISMTTPLSPIVITAPKESDFLFLVVPMRYKTNE